MQRKDLVFCEASPSLLERCRRSQRLVLELLLLEQPAQQDRLALGLEGPGLCRTTERSAIEDLPATAMKRRR
ncbi:hypothetical protein [Xanthomonas fragariae]|uniref:hypothetical protein n=1 Tax=Xanthomonas fragariae TaxID=48664 RepID=UPI001ABDE589|nr:hypothetical protein [Xanthomonas fragariae]